MTYIKFKLWHMFSNIVSFLLFGKSAFVVTTEMLTMKHELLFMNIADRPWKYRIKAWIGVRVGAVAMKQLLVEVEEKEDPNKLSLTLPLIMFDTEHDEKESTYYDLEGSDGGSILIIERLSNDQMAAIDSWG